MKAQKVTAYLLCRHLSSVRIISFNFTSLQLQFNITNKYLTHQSNYPPRPALPSHLVPHPTLELTHTQHTHLICAASRYPPTDAATPSHPPLHARAQSAAASSGMDSALNPGPLAAGAVCVHLFVSAYHSLFVLLPLQSICDGNPAHRLAFSSSYNLQVCVVFTDVLGRVSRASPCQNL